MRMNFSKWLFARGTPLTLTLSTSVAGREGAAYSFSPLLRGEGGGSRMRGNFVLSGAEKEARR